jgi:hypothetical protein
MSKKIKPEEEEAFKRIATVLIITQALLEASDEIKDTKYYRQTLKKAINDFDAEAKKSLGPHFTYIYNRDQKSFEVMTEAIIDIGKWVAHADFEDVYALAQAMKEGKLEFKPE